MSCACACAPVSSLSAQETINNASLTGRVTDPTGAALPHAAVSARSVTTGVTTRSASDGAGLFRFAYLPVGEYELTVESAGFASVRRNVTLTIGAAFDVPVMLRVGGASAMLTVDAVPPVLETGRSQVAGTISGNEVANLPYNGRNFLDLALLVPGVSPTNTAANQLFAETSAVAGQGISVSSQRNFSNSFILDGLSANDDAAGLVETSYGLDVVREMQVVTSGGQAEFGRALGGYISFVSKSGGSKLHGDLYGYLRDKHLNAQNALSQTLLPYTQVQAGASLSGPIRLPQRKDRVFYFGNFERRQLNQTGIITITPAQATAIDTVLAATGYPGQLLSISSATPTTIYPNPVRQSNFFAKVDDHIGDRDDLSLRYSLYRVSSINSRGVGGTAYTSAGAGLTDLDQTVAVSNLYAISPRTMNETRGQFTDSRLNAPVNDPVGPAVSISGVASFGTLSASPTARFDRLYEVVDNLSHQAGPHALRAGADLLFNDLTITYPQTVRGSYSFSSLANFQAGKYSTFTQSFGNDVVPQLNPNIGFYGQDEWKVGRALTLNLGLRYDLQFLKSIETDTNNVSPRFGFAWSPSRTGMTVVRGSFGLFYDRVPLRALSNALESDGNTTALNAATFVNFSPSFGQPGAPVFPGVDPNYTATTIPANIRLNLSTIDPRMKNAYSEQTSLEVDQQLTPTSNLAISYQHLRGIDLLVDVNLNTPTCFSSVDPVNLCRPNAAYANNKQYFPGADSYYDALTVSYVQRPVKWGSYRLSYTWSKAIDDVSEFFFSSPVNNFDLREDRSLADDDQRNRLVFDASAHTSLERATRVRERLTHGFLLSGILSFYSPYPFNITTGQNSVQTTTLRPCAPGFVLTATAANTCANALPGTLIGRNAGVGFDMFTLNARLSRTFVLGDRYRLQMIAEGFNALNRRNNQIPNATFGTGTYPSVPVATFGQATAVGDPRNVELAAKLSF